MKNNLLFLCILLIGLNGCASNQVTPSKSTSPATKVEKVTKSRPQAKKHTGTGTLIIKPIKFSKDAFIKDAVKNECDLEGKLSQFVEENASGSYSEIITNSTSKSSKAQILTITIEQVNGGRGRGGWGRRSAWGGSRGGNMVGISGTLTQGSKVLGDFKALRSTSGGAFSGFKGACAMLGRCVKTLGKDIAGWLTAPTPNASLGDF